jgi:N-acylglucosamine-6-phosphate 2-epimerase
MVEFKMIEQLKNGLIVSCQAPVGSPLRKPGMMREIALAAEAGGAVAIRAEGIQNIKDIVGAVKIPVIGLLKKYVKNSPIYITPEISDIAAVKKAGADIVAFDGTLRSRPNHPDLNDFVNRAKEVAQDTLLMADIDSLESGIEAEASGVDLVSTTLSGYTDGNIPGGPDLELISKLKNILNIPIIAEGRYMTPEQVKQAIDAGAWAVCVGKAITDPWNMTKEFIEAIS